MLQKVEKMRKEIQEIRNKADRVLQNVRKNTEKQLKK